MTCSLHPDTSEIDCDLCAETARAPYDPNCELCFGDGWIDPLPGFDPDQSVAIPCGCWTDPMAALDTAPHPDADDDGWLDGVTIIRAKFHGPKFKPGAVDTICLHCGHSSRPSWGRYFARPLDRDRKTGALVWRKVSTHAGVHDDGTLEQYVPSDHVSWNNGIANYSTMSFETQGPWRRTDWTDAMIDSLKWLTEQWMTLYPGITRAVSHRYLLPKRRSDPGPHFPYRIWKDFGLEVFR